MTLSTKTGYLSLQIYLPNVCVRAALSIINMYDKMGGMLKCYSIRELREWNLQLVYHLFLQGLAAMPTARRHTLSPTETFLMENNSSSVIYHKSQRPCCVLIQVAGLTAFENVSLAYQQMWLCNTITTLGSPARTKTWLRKKGINQSGQSLLSSADDAKLGFTIQHCPFVCDSKQDVANNASLKANKTITRGNMIRKRACYFKMLAHRKWTNIEGQKK